METLDSQHVTGRVSTHVHELADPHCFLHHRAAQGLLAMRAAARLEGIELAVVSSFRDFKHQAAIWNGKFRGERPLFDQDERPLEAGRLSELARIDAILQWSALPGASRHHWGSDLDVIDSAALPEGYRLKLQAEEFATTGIFAKLDRWLTVNMQGFGFFRPYGRYRGGVRPEPWHLSYAPLAVPALRVLTLDVLLEAVASGGLCGSATVLAQLPRIYERYVTSIDPPWIGPYSTY